RRSRRVRGHVHGEVQSSERRTPRGHAGNGYSRVRLPPRGARGTGSRHSVAHRRARGIRTRGWKVMGPFVMLAAVLGVFLLAFFVAGGFVALVSMWLMERVLHVHTPSSEDISELLGDRVAEELEGYLDAVNALQEMSDGDEDE